MPSRRVLLEIGGVGSRAVLRLRPAESGVVLFRRLGLPGRRSLSILGRPAIALSLPFPFCLLPGVRRFPFLFFEREYLLLRGVRMGALRIFFDICRIRINSVRLQSCCVKNLQQLIQVRSARVVRIAGTSRMIIHTFFQPF